MTNTFNTAPDGPRLTSVGKFFIFLFIVATLAGAYWLFLHRAHTGNAGNDPANGGSTALQPSGTATPRSGDTVEIGVAYGTEKKRWLENAVDEFAKSPEGRGITVNLIPMGSLEGAQAVVKEDKRINAWTPASTLYTETFLADYQVKFSQNPILKQENLAYTPMVFIMWEQRYEAFIKKYKALSFDTISQAIAEPGGWDAIAGKPQWGVFKFAHTHPNQSASGLSTLMLMGYTYHNKSKNLELADLLNLDFQKWLGTTENGVSSLSNSTGKLVQEMVLKGPSSFDCVFAYESTAIDFLQNAEGRWGKIRIVYPKYNLWNESPYYVLNVPWSTPAQRTVAETFMHFLLTEPIQRLSIPHGFRPANTAVSVKFDQSPFVTYAPYGISDDLGTICEPPKGEVITNLLQIWQRLQH